MDDELLPEVAAIMHSHAQEWADLPARWSLTPPQARLRTIEMCRRWNRDMPKMSSISEHLVLNRHRSEIRTKLFVPPDADGSLIVYLHGGGWAVGDIDTHEGTTRHLAEQSGSAVLSCNYRLAPEHPYPSGLQDCIDVWRRIHQEKLPTEYEIDGPIAMAGDSSGANLALSCIFHELLHSQTIPDFFISFYGAYERNFTSESYLKFGNGPGITFDELKRFWDWYNPHAEQRKDMLVEPGLASDELLRQLPPVFMAVAEIDPLVQENRKLYARLAGAGRPDIWREYKGVPHGFIQMNSELALARQAIADAGQSFREFKAMNRSQSRSHK